MAREEVFSFNLARKEIFSVNLARRLKKLPTPVLGPFQQVRGFNGGFAQGLWNLKICGDKLSSDSSSAEQFVNEFSGITEGYSKHKISIAIKPDCTLDCSLDIP